MEGFFRHVLVKLQCSIRFKTNKSQQLLTLEGQLIARYSENYAWLREFWVRPLCTSLFGEMINSKFCYFKKLCMHRRLCALQAIQKWQTMPHGFFIIYRMCLVFFFLQASKWREDDRVKGSGKKKSSLHAIQLQFIFIFLPNKCILLSVQVLS